ncbi:MAG: hypothetical protein M9894_28790 [Planctomycetes bacterium]|nr:hypothetical protein [Planctomycetota bacterium]
MSEGDRVSDVRCGAAGLLRRGLAAALAIVTAGAVAAGCRTAGVAVLGSTRPMRPGGYEVKGDAKGTSWSGYFYVLHLIPIHFGPVDPAGRARDAALEDFPGADAMVDVVMDRMMVFLPIPIVHVVLTITDVEGQAVRALPEPPPAGERGK